MHESKVKKDIRLFDGLGFLALFLLHYYFATWGFCIQPLNIDL